jgi:hypothetical protein
MRPRDFLDALDNPDAPKCGATGEHAEMLRILLVHLFFVDHDLDRGELACWDVCCPTSTLPSTSRPPRCAGSTLDRLAQLFPDPVDRDDIVTLAEHAVWGDNRVEPEEWDLVDRLVEKLGVTGTRGCPGFPPRRNAAFRPDRRFRPL